LSLRLEGLDAAGFFHDAREHEWNQQTAISACAKPQSFGGLSS
jgi:hypothetical protein